MASPVNPRLVSLLVDVLDRGAAASTAAAVDDLSLVADRLDESVLVADPASRVLYANPAAQRRFAVVAGELLPAAHPALGVGTASVPHPASLERPSGAGRPCSTPWSFAPRRATTRPTPRTSSGV